MVINGLFLPGRRLFSEVRKYTFLREEPFLVDRTEITVITRVEHDRVGSVHLAHVHPGSREGGVYTT